MVSDGFVSEHSNQTGTVLSQVTWATTGKGTPAGLGWAIRVIAIVAPLLVLWGHSMLVLAWGTAVALWWMFVLQAAKTSAQQEDSASGEDGS